MATITMAEQINRTLRSMEDVARKQVPFAVAVGLTKTAQLAQAGVLDVMRQRFDKPTPFSLNSLRVVPARKSDAQPFAKVYFKDDAFKGTLTDIQRAARFFYLQQQAFGGKVDGQTWGTATTAPPVNLLRIEENLSAAHLRLSGAYIENMDWYKCMERYDRVHTLFYLDPPYLETAGYGVDFPLSEYERMADLMSRIKGKAILSLNDHPEIRRIFDRFQMDATGISYTVGGGAGVQRQELIIYSWDRAAEPAGLF